MVQEKIVAVSFKSYFSIARAKSYCEALATCVREEPAVKREAVRMAVFPSFLAIPSAVSILSDVPIMVGAQNAAEYSRGAFTGEVPAEDVAESGCELVEIGHAERRTHYGESSEVIQRKMRAVLDAGLTPLLCIGESLQQEPSEAAALCAKQVLDAVTHTNCHAEIWLGYEPYWAIGAPSPAPPPYVRNVCGEIRRQLRSQNSQFKLLYGGSAGPGLAAQLGTSVDGLFLGRFAHEPAHFLEVVQEISQ